MKKLSIICSMLMVFGVISAPAFAVNDYDVDYLESGNPGGVLPGSLKTWDSAGILVNDGDTFLVDVWMRNASGAATNGGLWIDFDGDLLAITAVDAYDGSVLPGPWTAGNTGKIPNPTGGSPPNSYAVTLANLAGVAPDSDGDIPTARVTFECLGEGVADVVVMGIPSFDTWAPALNGWDNSLIVPLNFDITCVGGGGDPCDGVDCRLR